MLHVRVQNVFYQCFFNTEVKNMKNFNASIALNVILFLHNSLLPAVSQTVFGFMTKTKPNEQRVAWLQMLHCRDFPGNRSAARRAVGPRGSGLTYMRPRRRRVQWGSVANRPNYEQNAAACRRRPEIDIYSAGHRYRVLTAFTGSERNYSFAQIRRRAKWNLTLDPTGLHLGYPSCKGSMQRNCKGESKLCRYFELT